MKKLLFLILCTTTLGLVSCKKDTIIQETPNRTYIYTIQPSSWITSNNGQMHTAELPVKEIDGITLDDEGVLVYLSHPALSTSYIQVPFTWNGNAYSYELYNGGIDINIQSADSQFLNPAKPTQVMTAKIVIIPSQFQP
ncbi:hypothetical protein [Pedobacter frigoris]|uniref:Uncharacterized protein n=1 Tax=Pedobacter frigoris TaxID=2571272 RepID=A0A4U1CP06_9SPHI|nr:hypothetical protein [Pedobacter frigoris]TKC08560.1 hypothetical protein FA047_00205 [Pedobacter frigoris]